MNRRTFVAAAGVGLGAAVAGCLGDDPNDGSDPTEGEENGSDENETDDPGDGTDGTPTDESEGPSGGGNDRNETDGDDPNGEDGSDDPGEEPDGTGYTVTLEDDPIEDAGEFATLRVELADPHVEPESPAAIEATLTNDTEGKVEVSSGAPSPFGVLWAEPDDGSESITLWNDAYEETGHVKTEGKRVEEIEDIGLVEKIDAGGSVARTFEIYEETPGLGAGTYTEAVSCRIEAADGGENFEAELVLAIERGRSELENDDGSEEARIDEPPYEIEEPEPPDDPGEDDGWNEDYLGEGMPAEPSLEFEELDGVRLETRALSIRDGEGDQYALDLLESEGALEERFDLEAMEPEDRERIEDIDFDERVVAVVESGFGSGSVRHRWKRVEESEEGIHLHGYYTQPYERTDDYTSRQSALVVERPDRGPEPARASLTVSPDRRVRFDSTEDVVAVEDGD